MIVQLGLRAVRNTFWKHTVHWSAVSTEACLKEPLSVQCYRSGRGITLSSTSASGAAGVAECERQYSESRTRHAGRSVATSGVRFLQQATGDYDLHVRLAALWGMPSELLFERQQAVAKMLAPCGCGSAAHALWLLVRSPTLRHASEASLRQSVRQLHRLVSHAEIDRAAVLSAVYKYPWVIEAVCGNTHVTADMTAATVAAAATQQPVPGDATAPAAEPHSSAALQPASWSQELAAVVVELQQADWAEHVSSGKATRGIMMSPGYAALAVRLVLTVGEIAKSVSDTVSGTANRLLGIVPQQQSSDDDSHQQAEAQLHPGGPEDVTAAGDILQRLQQQQQQHLLLQQLLAACPPLIALPPEILLARWHALLSVVHGCSDAALALVVYNPYLLVGYKDNAELRADAQLLQQSYA